MKTILLAAALALSATSAHAFDAVEAEARCLQAVQKSEAEAQRLMPSYWPNEAYRREMVKVCLAEKLYREKQREEVQQERLKEEQRQAEGRKPQNVLLNLYTAYIVVKRCHEARAGYAGIYISEPEMQRAREAVSILEAKVKPYLSAEYTTSLVWSGAEKAARSDLHSLSYGFNHSSRICRNAFQFLDIAADKIAPAVTEKDF